MNSTKLYSCARDLYHFYKKTVIFSHARNMISAMGSEESDTDRLKQDLAIYVQSKSEAENALLDMWDRNNNMNLLMAEGVCFIRYLKGNGQKGIEIMPVKKQNLDLIRRNLEVEGDITQEQLREYASPVVVDTEALNAFTEECKREAQDVLKEYVKQSKPRNEKWTASVHSVERYIEKVLKITEKNKAKHECVHNFLDHKKAVTEMFEKADVFWEESDEILHKITRDDNYILVGKQKEKVIMTVYEKDFGFSKEINRNIIFMQLEEIKKARKDLEEAEQNCKAQVSVYNRHIERCDEELEIIQDKIRELKEEAENIKQDKKNMEYARESVKSHLKESNKAYDDEYYKIFRPYKVV